ncbi:MAG: hypothetical protein ABSF24_09015 [Candidatus Bathyarchaeia archaeon]|jgi:hypothetical protein
MVTKQQLACLSVIVLILCLGSLLTRVQLARAQDVTYSVSQEWAQIQINTDRSIYILYNITFTYLSGSPEGIFTVGMPQGGFQIQYVQDLLGATLHYQDASSGSFYGIDVYLEQPVAVNQSYTFVVYALVPDMIHEDTPNPGNVDLLFYQATFTSASGSVTDLRVEIILPPSVQTTEVKYPSGSPFDNVFTETNNDTAVFWERTDWPPGQQFTSGVSFPATYVSSAPTPTPAPFPDAATTVLLVLVFFIVGAAIFVGLKRVARMAYATPRMSIEALGANRTLTAVEAALVLDQKPVRVLTMILYGLLLKRMVAVTETEPLIKLTKLEPAQGQPAPRPRYYETDYLNAIRPDGTLDEQKLASTYVELTNTVDQKLRGYSRDDTTNYYKSIVDKAWTQVTQAGTPELKGDAVDKNLEWLLADDKFEDRFRTAFPPGIIIYPNPAWWWYWGGLHAPTGQQRPPTPVTTPTAPPAQAKPIPGQDFANNIVRGLQTASNNIVKNVQDFANKLVPFKSPPSQHPVGGKPSCVCACHACACACACVGCACACAGGGAR